MGNAFCRKDSLPTDIEYKDCPEYPNITAEEGANSGNNSNITDEPTDNLSSASSELVTICDEGQHVQFAKRAMDFHNGWTPEVEEQLAKIFRLSEDQIEKLKEKSKKFERGLSEEEQQVEFAKKAMQIHKGWDRNVEQDVKRIFRLNEEQLGNLKVRTLEAVEERKKAFRVRWLDDCTQIGDIVQFNEDYFSEQLTSLTNIPTTTDAASSKVIDDAFSEPHEDTDAHTEYHTGDEVFLVRLFSDTDLNAQEGVVIEMPNDKGKYLVQLHKSDEEVLVMERNLSLMKNNTGGLLEVVFDPGEFGFAFDTEDGRVTGIFTGGQADKWNVREGWKIVKINDEAYSKNLVEKVDSKRENVLTFNTKHHFPSYPNFA